MENLIFYFADDDLILGYRDCEWTGVGPFLEEDLALSSIAQDEISHASMFYEIIGNPDDFVYKREPKLFKNAYITELENYDYVFTLVRHLFYDEFDYIRIGALLNSSNYELKSRAEKIIIEEDYHLKHFRIILNKLAQKEEGKKVISNTIDKFKYELFSIFEVDNEILKVYGTDIFPISYEEHFDKFYERIKLDFPFYKFPSKDEVLLNLSSFKSRRGEKSESFLKFYETFTEVYRLEPDARW
ncbi:MAG: 1,2-phenylacetyl-CoA epoxidase subunit PaaC [candidate division WOR-3 bacterium]|nr:phenylacetate-CoA oxygenase subunit PaaC [candidate division WOR-3 bacterium]MDW8149838.1 1,2-phenylacetyl-CoA epoxidase subunit PaaC [candidate division WOR-3 bacterium]